MPRKDETEAGVEKKSVNKKVTAEEIPAETSVKSTPPWPLITVAAVASVVIAAFAVIFTLMLVANQARQQGPGYGNNGWQGGGGGFNHHSNDEYGGGQGKRLYLDAVRGVVTAVDGDTLTISGGGKQVKVVRTSDTVVNGDKMDVAVNDTVVVIGQKGDDGTFTAKAIVIRNDAESVNSMPFERRPQL